MNFWERAATLLAIAAWIPVLVGVLARVFYFRRDQYQAVASSEATRRGLQNEFAIPNQEPPPDDSNYPPLYDKPFPPGSPPPRPA